VLEAVSRPHEPVGAFASIPAGDSGAYAAMDRSASASSCAQRYAPTIRNQARFLVTMAPVIPACKTVQTTLKKATEQAALFRDRRLFRGTGRS
jgi:hypothetical protein